MAMLNRDYEGQNCSIARALEVVGERWTLLIIRDVLLGLHRFDEFQESLGIARNVLTDRLNRLVDEGVLERALYSERPERYEYQLTKKGLDLQIALTALRQWGDDYLSEKPPRLLRRKVDKTPVVAALVPKGNQDATGRRGRGGRRARRQRWRSSSRPAERPTCSSLDALPAAASSARGSGDDCCGSLRSSTTVPSASRTATGSGSTSSTSIPAQTH